MTIAILDFGSQFSQLIARRVREAGVYCELFPWDAPPDRVTAIMPNGIILSGGPNSVYDAGAPHLQPYIIEAAVPVLGICYGMHLLAHALGGQVTGSNKREYGQAQVQMLPSELLPGAIANQPASTEDMALSVWMSHGDNVTRLPPGFESIAQSANAPISGMVDRARKLYAIQFHPEVNHTQHGREIISNFVHEICGCDASWSPGNIVEQSIKRIKQQVGARQVICGLSGGVDSSVAAALVHRAIGDQLTCVFVDTGMMRKGEGDQVIETFRQNLGIRLIAINASEDFLSALHNVSDPEAKRTIIGEKFVRTFESVLDSEIGAQSDSDWQTSTDQTSKQFLLCQGTLYPDVIESRGPERQSAAKIKTHHNVGGLPANMRFELLEPLRFLFKDEVRNIGLELGLPDDIVWRQPFPGPGLAVRCLGNITWERLERLRAADAIMQEEFARENLLRTTSQAFVVLLPVRSVGVMGDGRTYAEVCAIRAVTTDDFMTADWARIPYDVLARVSSRIVNEVPGINRVTYDITSKPPGTIEWE